MPGDGWAILRGMGDPPTVPYGLRNRPLQVTVTWYSHCIGLRCDLLDPSDRSVSERIPHARGMEISVEKNTNTQQFHAISTSTSEIDQRIKCWRQKTIRRHEHFRCSVSTTIFHTSLMMFCVHISVLVVTLIGFKWSRYRIRFDGQNDHDLHYSSSW